MNSAHRSSRRTWLSRRRFLTAAGFAALAACRGGFEQPRQDTVPQPASGTITWLQRAQPVEVEWAERIVLPRLRELAPNVTINLTLESGNWADKVFTLYAAGTPPDVHNGIVGTFIQLYAQEEVLELTPLIKRDKIDLSPFGGFQNDPDMCRSGKQWELPVLTTLGQGIFYNMDLFDKAGLPYPPTDWQDRSWTMERMAEVARRLTTNWGAEDAVYGLVTTAQFHFWAYPWGGDPFKPEWYAHGIATETQADHPLVVQSLQFRVDLIYRYQVHPTPGEQSRIAQGGHPFKTGRVAMWWGTGWEYASLAEGAGFRLGFAPFPWKATNKTVAFTDGVMITRRTKAPEASWALVKYLTSREGQLEYARATKRPPTRQDALEPWVTSTFPLTGFTTVRQFEQATFGFLSNYIDNWAHYTINARELQAIQDREGPVMWRNEASPAQHMPVVKQHMDAVLREAYERFKDTRLLKDTRC